MNIGTIREIPVTVKRIMQDNRRPHFSNKVNVMKKAGTSIAKIVNRKYQYLSIDDFTIFI